MRRRHSTPRTNAGSSLIEVLISVFVLAVGLLGTASLQMTSKRSNLEARERTTATVVAQDIVERMRANPGQLAVYTDAGVGRTLTGTTMAAVDCSVDCTDAQMALHDLYELEQALIGVSEQVGGSNVGGLVAPQVCVAGPNGGSGTYTIAIAWRGRTRLSDPTLNACGQGSGAYDSNDGTESDVYRRVLVIDTFIAEPI